MFVNIFLELGIFLVLILAVLLTLLFLRAKKKKASVKKTIEEPSVDLLSLIQNIKLKTTSKEALQENLDLVLKHYGEIENFSYYEEILITITLHPNTNKNIILNFDRALSKRNPEYKQRISDTVTSSLKLR